MDGPRPPYPPDTIDGPIWLHPRPTYTIGVSDHQTFQVLGYVFRSSVEAIRQNSWLSYSR